MAVAITDQGVAQTTPGSSATNTVTSASFAAPANGLFVVVAYIDMQGTTTSDVASFTLSDTFVGTGTWGERVTIAHEGSSSGSYDSRISIWTATIGATPGTHTITVTRTARTADQWLWANFFTVTGQHASPIGATGSHGQITGATNTITMSGAPASTSLVIGAQNMGGTTGAATIVEPSGWSEIHNDVAAGGWGDEIEVAYINGGATQTFNWSGLAGNDVEDACALEIIAAAAAFVAPPSPQINQTVTTSRYW